MEDSAGEDADKDKDDKHKSTARGHPVKCSSSRSGLVHVYPKTDSEWHYLAFYQKVNCRKASLIFFAINSL